MWPPVLVGSLQLIKAQHTKQFACGNVHKLFLLPLAEFFWPLSQLLYAYQKKHHFNVGLFAVKLIGNTLLQGVPFQIDLGGFHWSKDSSLVHLLICSPVLIFNANSIREWIRPDQRSNHRTTDPTPK